MLFVVATVFLHLQIPHEETPAKKLRLSKPSKSAALHIDLCKATNSTDALQYLLQFARKPVEAESVEGVVRILLEHYYKVKSCGYFFSPFFKNRVDKSRISSVLKKSQTSKDDDSFFQETDNSVRLKIASLLGLLSKTQGFSPDCIVDDAINTLSNESTTHLNIYPSPTLRETFIANCFVSLCVQSPIKFSPSCWRPCWSLVHSCPRVLHWDWGS